MKVELINKKDLVTGESQVIGFLLEDEAGVTSQVPLEATNRHYQEIKAWYEEQDQKPFDFEFEETPEPNFAETIYPKPEESEEVVTPDEPRTMLVK